MKTALVLGGGGAKGAYELGVLEALETLEIKYDIVTGTSIGSLNGIFAKISDIDTLRKVWTNISLDQVLKKIDIRELSFDLANLQRTTKDDEDEIHPLKNLIQMYIDEYQVRNSDIDFGLVCVSVSNMKPIEISIEDIPQGKLCDYLLASCALFPAFPMCKIDDKQYIDGGFYDHVPINFAVSMGATNIIAIDVLNKPTHPEYMSSPLVKYINTAWDLGSMLDFDADNLQRSRVLGYNETMKAYNKMFGFRYTFSFKGLKGIETFSQRFAKNVLMFESAIPKKNPFVKKLISYPLTKVIKEHSKDKLNKSEFFIRGLEICMEVLNLNPVKIYNARKVNEAIIEHFLDKQSYKYTELFKNIDALSMKIDKKYLVGCILYKICETKTFTEDIYILANIFPKETTCAIYVYSLLEETEN